jgi:hypothetical protein
MGVRCRRIPGACGYRPADNHNYYRGGVKCERHCSPATTQLPSPWHSDAEFLASRDGGGFQPAQAAYAWKLHRGANQLAMRVRNRARVLGPVSRLEVAWEPAP